MDGWLEDGWDKLTNGWIDGAGGGGTGSDGEDEGADCGMTR